MWNHRNLDDPVQHGIETVIKDHVDGYGYGVRRESQVDEINRSGLFGQVQTVSNSILHEQSITDCIEAWRSHATLFRQAGDRFPAVIEAISDFLAELGPQHVQNGMITVPYTTNIWMARLQAK